MKDSEWIENAMAELYQQCGKLFISPEMTPEQIEAMQIRILDFLAFDWVDLDIDGVDRYFEEDVK